MTRLLLVRHGQSTWNAEGKWQGQADPPLTRLGENQAAAAIFAVGAVDAIISSDLQRARRTAEIIAQGVGIGPVQVTSAIRERHAGEWQGLRRSDISEGWPGAPENGVRPPGWEPDEEVLARAHGAIIAIGTALDGGSALVITHTGLVYELEKSLGLEHERIANLEAREFFVKNGELFAGERLLLIDPDEVEKTENDQL